MWDSGVWFWEPVVGGAIHFWESIFMHTPRVCIFSMYFRQLLRLVWVKHFKMQFLHFLTSDALKALTKIKFLTISLNKRPLSPLKTPSFVPSSLLSVWMLAMLPCWTSPDQQGVSFCVETLTGQRWTSRSQVHVQSFLETSGNTKKPSTELPHPMEWRRSIQLVLGEYWYIFSRWRADSERKSVGCVSCGRRLVMNTKGSQNYEL